MGEKVFLLPPLPLSPREISGGRSQYFSVQGQIQFYSLSVYARDDVEEEAISNVNQSGTRLHVNQTKTTKILTFKQFSLPS